MSFKFKIFIMALMSLPSLAYADEMKMSFKQQAIYSEDHLYVRDIIDESKTSDAFLEKFGQVDVKNLITDNNVHPSQVLLTLARAGMDLSSVKILSSISQDIKLKKENGFAALLKKHTLDYANKSGLVAKYLDFKFDSSQVENVPYLEGDDINIQSIGDNGSEQVISYLITSKNNPVGHSYKINGSLVKGYSVVVAKESLMPGENITADKVELSIQSVPTGSEFIDNISYFSGSKIVAKDSIKKGESINKNSVNASTNLEKGAIVTLTTSGDKFQIRALGRVKDILDNGASVLVENIDSKKELIGQPISANEVKIIY